MFPKLQEIQYLFCILLQQKSSRIIIITLCSSSRRGTHGVIILSLCSSSRNPSNSDQNYYAYAGAERNSEQRLTSGSRLEWREATGEGSAASGEGSGAVIRPFCIMHLYQYLLHYGLLLHIISQYLWLFSLILQGLPWRGGMPAAGILAGKGANIGNLFCTAPKVLRLHETTFWI